MLLRSVSIQLTLTHSHTKVCEQTKLWTQKSGVVGHYFGDELYADLFSVSVARGPHGESAPSMVHALAAFWQAVTDVIVLHTDRDVWPHQRWTRRPRYHNLNLTVASACAVRGEDNDGVTSNSGVHMIVLPDCPALYDYATFTTIVAAVEFSKPLCVHLGRHLSLTAFHPQFKNSPQMMSPERHAPFPVVGLQVRSPALGDADLPLGGQQWAQQQNVPREQSKTNDDGRILPLPDDRSEYDDDDTGALADARIRNLDDRRASLEVLFNSAAAVDATKGGGRSRVSADPTARSAAALAEYPTATSSSSSYSSISDNDENDTPVPEEEQLAHNFRHERQRRRNDLPPEMVRQVIALWMDEQRYADSEKRQLNPALEFMETIDGYTVCTQKMGELVYAEIWQAIRQVFERGQVADQEAAVVATASADDEYDDEDTVPEETTKPTPSKNRFDLSRWMYSLSGRDGRQDAAAASNGNRDDHDDELPQVTSTLFIATKFNTYNAQAFKRFVITINAALKRITGGRMFLEVFHPEYVGNHGYTHALRRSPFPMIQICYLVQPAEDSHYHQDSSSPTSH